MGIGDRFLVTLRSNMCYQDVRQSRCGAPFSTFDDIIAHVRSRMKIEHVGVLDSILAAENVTYESFSEARDILTQLVTLGPSARELMDTSEMSPSLLSTITTSISNIWVDVLDAGECV